MSYRRTFLLDLNNDNSKHGLDLVCFLKDTSGQTVEEFSNAGVEIEKGVYQITIYTAYDDHRGSLLVYANTNDSSSTSSSSEESLTYLAGFAINPEECEYVKALYHAEIDLVIDDANGVDRWTVAYFKNGVQIRYHEEGFADQLLNVRDENGVSVLASVSLTQVSGTSNFWRYYATGAERSSPGDNLTAVARATIDGALREFPRILGRDN